MSIPSLPDLPPDLHWLIYMPPIRKALDEYRYGFPQKWVPIGAHTRTLFTISNIFASPYATPVEQQTYDLIFDHEAANQDYSYLTPWEEELALEREVFEEQAQRLAVDHPEKTLDEWVDVSREMMLERRAFALRLRVTPCHALANYWGCTLERYQKQPHPLFLPSADRDLRLVAQEAAPWAQEYTGKWPTFYAPCTLFDPHVSLPRRKMVEELRHEEATADLMLLTARHELGSIYEEVRAWYTRASARDGLDPLDMCLKPWHAGLLSARARGRRSWTLGPVSDALHRRRDDNLVEKVEPQCDLSRLYYELFTWCKATYDAVLAPPLCNRDGCERTARPRADGRGWRLYCSDECERTVRHKTFQRASRKYRASIKRPRRR